MLVYADRARRSHTGADRVPDPRHVRVPHDGDAVPRIHADGARRTGLEDHRLRLEGRRPLLGDALAEDPSLYEYDLIREPLVLVLLLNSLYHSVKSATFTNVLYYINSVL